jgi:hypothetical protein
MLIRAMAHSKLRSLLLGLISGVIGGAVCIILVYLCGTVAIAIQVKELFPTLLAALTVLPLMIILILLLPTTILSLLIGLLAGTVLNLRNSAVSFLVTISISLVLVEIVFAGLLPMIAASDSSDFVSMASNPYIAGLYGLTLGALINRFFSWFNKSN